MWAEALPQPNKRTRVLSRWVMSAWAKRGSTTPDAEDHLFNELFWAASEAGLGQVPALQCFLQADAVEHALARGPQATPGEDFTGGELQMISLESSYWALSGICQNPGAVGVAHNRTGGANG